MTATMTFALDAAIVLVSASVIACIAVISLLFWKLMLVNAETRPLLARLLLPVFCQYGGISAAIFGFASNWGALSQVGFLLVALAFVLAPKPVVALNRRVEVPLLITALSSLALLLLVQIWV